MSPELHKSGKRGSSHQGHGNPPSDDLSIVEESATTQIARMSRELLGPLGCPNTVFLATKVVDRTDVVQPTTRNEVPTGRVRAGHDPTGTQGYGMDFV